MSEHNIVIERHSANPRYPYYTRCSCGFGGHGRTYAQADFFKRSHQHAHHLTVDVPQIEDPNLPQPEPPEDESPLAAGADAPEEKAPETVTETSESNMEAGQ